MPNPSRLRVAAIQPGGYPFDPAAALDHLRAATADAAHQGAQLVLFPEAFIGGYPWQPVDKIPTAFERRCIRAGRFARLSHNVNSTLPKVM